MWKSRETLADKGGFSESAIVEHYEERKIGESILSRKKPRIFKLGELEPFFLIHIAQLYEMYVNWMHIFCSFWNYRVSGKFPKTAWWAIHSRQTTHAKLSVFWVPEKEPPRGMTLAARWHMPATQFLGFWMKCLVVMNTRQATRTYSLDFNVLRILRWFWLGGK